MNTGQFVFLLGISFAAVIILVGSGVIFPAAATSAQNVIDTSSLDVACEPMVSNATIPDPSEDVLPPEIYMIFGNKVYLGELSESKYREGETFSDLDILPENISSELPAETVSMEIGTCAQFIVRGTPSTILPDSLDVSAYFANGTSFGVLNATEDNSSTFRFDLPNGKYILLTTATWIPSAEDEYVTGYIIYKFLIDIPKN